MLGKRLQALVPATLLFLVWDSRAAAQEHSSSVFAESAAICADENGFSRPGRLCEMLRATNEVASTFPRGPASRTRAVWEAVLLPLAVEQRLRTSRFTLGERKVKEDLFNAIGVDTEQAGVIDSYAVDVVERERAYWIELNQEMICDRREAFETGTQLGRAWNEVQRLRTAEQERLVEGLWGVVDPGAAEQIVRFSVDTVKMTQEIDGETYYRERAGEELNTIIDVICRRR